MVNTMARRTDGGVRFRPVGSRRSRTAPVYSPRGTGCPAIEQAVQGLYKGQNEESFWSLMSALNYALELETHVLVPLQTALSAQGAPAPWMEHPIPAEKADGLALWTLRNDKGRCWLPLFTSVAAAGADRSTGSRPMADRTLEQAMQLALDLYGPMYLLYSVYDAAEEKETVAPMLAAHIRRFIARIETGYRWNGETDFEGGERLL